MSKNITIVNAANAFARNYLKSLRGYENVYLGDIFNSRHSVFLS